MLSNRSVLKVGLNGSVSKSIIMLKNELSQRMRRQFRKRLTHWLRVPVRLTARFLKSSLCRISVTVHQSKRVFQQFRNHEMGLKTTNGLST